MIFCSIKSFQANKIYIRPLELRQKRRHKLVFGIVKLLLKILQVIIIEVLLTVI